MRPLPSALLLSLATAASLLAADPVSAVCSPDEAAVLAAINEYRADTALWDSQVASAIKAGAMGKVSSGAWGMYVSNRSHGAKKVRMPVVWDAKLTVAARAAVARFPRSAEGVPNDPGPDLTAAGLTATPATALLLAEDHSDLRFLVRAAVLQCIKEEVRTNSTLKVFSREYLVDPAVTACGIALAKAGNGWRLAIVVGDQAAGRASGGAVFRDENRNGRMDQGEPPVAAEIALPAAGAAMPFASGVWTVPITGATAVDGKATIAGLTTVFTLPAQAGNSWTLLPAPEKQDIDEAKKLLAAAAKAKPDDEAPDKAVFELAFRRPTLALDGATAAQVDQVAAPAVQAIERARRGFMDIIGEDKGAISKQLAETQRKWKGRGGDWVAFAKGYHQLHQQYGAWGISEKEERVKGARDLLKAIDQLAAKNVDAVLWGQVTNWRLDLDLCVYAADRAAATSDKKDDKKKPKK